MTNVPNQPTRGAASEFGADSGADLMRQLTVELEQGFSAQAETTEPFGPLTNLIGLFSSSLGVNAVAIPGLNAIVLPDGSVKGGGNPPVPAGVAFKANTYNEVKLSFNMIGGPVRNRAASFRDGVLTNDPQTVHALEYQQVIGQIEGPPPAGLQHIEDGMWMWTQPQSTIARLAAIPHGNSFLCWGEFKPSIHQTTGKPPDIPDIDFSPVLPKNPPQELVNFVTRNYNQEIQGTGVTPAHINQGLIRVVEAQVQAGYKFQEVITLIVNSDNPNVPPPPHPGGVSNIDFILNNANFTGISTTFWIETIQPPPDDSVNPPFQPPPFVQLQYSQNISLTFPLPEDASFGAITFPHVDVNTLLRQSRVAL